MPRTVRPTSCASRGGGRLVVHGAHPCFDGPHTQWLDDGEIVALAEFLTAFIGAGLEIEHVAEMGDRPVPTVLAIRARMSTHRSDL